MIKSVCKIAFALLCLTAAAVPLRAAEPETTPDSTATIVDTLNRSGVIRIDVPEELRERLVPVEVSEKDAADDDSQDGKSVTTPRGHSGFRVEVFADNNVRTAKVKAANKKAQIQRLMPQYRVYLVFESPFWRVRMGDFTSRAAAESALAEARRKLGASSGLRIVRSTINPQ